MDARMVGVRERVADATGFRGVTGGPAALGGARTTYAHSGEHVRGEFVLTPESVCETDRDNAASKYIGEGQQARSVRKMRRRIAPA